MSTTSYRRIEEKSPIILTIGNWILGFKGPLKEHHDAKERLIDNAADMSTEAKLEAHKKNDYQYYAEVAGVYATNVLALFVLPKLANYCWDAIKLSSQLLLK